MKKRTLLIYTAIVLLTSCQDWLTIQPETKSTKNEMFSTDAGFRDLLNGAYYSLGQTYSPSGPLIREEIEYLASQWHTPSSGAPKELNDHEYESESVDASLKKMFESMYTVLVNLNVLIDALENEEGVLNERNKALYFGQALAMRAYVNFDLLRLFGPVPTEVNKSKRYLPYPKKAQIEYHEYFTYDEFRKHLEDDMDKAVFYLDKDENKTYSISRLRFNYYAAKALQARYYLWVCNKERAKECAEIVLERSKYDSAEKPFVLATHANMAGSLMPFFECENIVGVHVYASFTLSPQGKHYTSGKIIDEMFENDLTDLRYSHWHRMSFEEGFGIKMMPKKFVLDDKSQENVIHTPLIRLSEIYFILMECSGLEQANELYTEFCIARGISFRSLTESNLKNRIINESRREFSCEGQLFYLYKRLFLNQIPNNSKGLNTSSYVLPIPSAEFLN